MADVYVDLGKNRNNAKISANIVPDNKSYDELNNKPKINGIELKGDKSSEDFGIFSYDDTDIKKELQRKVEKEYGKGLSTNDYTNEEKEKLANLTNYNDEEIKKSIENKADKSEIPTKVSELENDSNYAKTNTNNNFSTSQTINGTLTVNGDIVQKGKTYKTDVEEVTTKQNNITLRQDAIGGMSAEEFAGLIALIYNGINNGRLGFKADGTAYVGDVRR